MTDMSDKVAARIAELGDKYLLAGANRIGRKTPPDRLRERDVARYFKDRVKALKGDCRKVRWEGVAHAPDLLVMFPGRFCFVETKRPGAVARPGQAREHERMRAAGMEVFVLDSLAAVDRWVQDWAQAK